jgi:hypothetical protein
MPEQKAGQKEVSPTARRLAEALAEELFRNSIADAIAYE